MAGPIRRRRRDGRLPFYAAAVLTTKTLGPVMPDLAAYLHR